MGFFFVDDDSSHKAKHDQKKDEKKVWRFLGIVGTVILVGWIMFSVGIARL